MFLLFAPAESTALTPNDFFRVKIVDATTGRGIPMVKLQTNNGIKYYTDSAGAAALYEPGLMNQDVRLSLESPGYASDGPGWEDDLTVTMKPGASRTIEMTPQNIADRLYRQSGTGVYQASHLAGDETPINRPLLNNGSVVGQDSVNTAVFRGKLYWFWDDTGILGKETSLHGTGATSVLPSKGGLDPGEGINLNYFVNQDGKAVQMFNRRVGHWIVWLNNLMVVEDSMGRQTMYSTYVFPFKHNQKGVAKWDDNAKRFKGHRTFPDEQRVLPDGRTFRVQRDGREWFYFGRPYPVVRVPATERALSDPDQYEALTPLRAGTRLSDGEVERDATGNPVWGWKPNTTSLNSAADRARLRGQTSLDSSGDVFHLRGIKEGRSIRAHRGTVYWNDHREKWIMILNEAFGKHSLLGDLWYAEADSPIGPWVYARRIVRHTKHSCYNVKQHRMLDQAEGKRVFFECTYSESFASGRATPRYNYNQIMYRLDLSEASLHLPSPVYHYEDPEGNHRYDTLKGLPARSASPPSENGTGSVARDAPIPFYGLPADRPRPRSVAVWSRRLGTGAVQLTLEEPPSSRGESPAFYAYPPDGETEDPNLVAIREFEHTTSGKLRYAPTDPGPDWRGSGTVFRAWKSPNRRPPREPEAEPVTTCMGASAVCDSAGR